jgi:hypothetical protein
LSSWLPSSHVSPVWVALLPQLTGNVVEVVDVLVLLLDVDDVEVVAGPVLEVVVVSTGSLVDVLLLVGVGDEVLVDGVVILLLLVDALVLEDVEVELEVDEEVLVDDVLVLVVVVVAFGLQRGSTGPSSGTAAWSMQSVANSVTQSTQVTRSLAVSTGPAQLAGSPSNGRPYGQEAGKPIEATGTSSVPSQSLSAPPHALQMVAIFFVSALPSASAVLPVASSGQVRDERPFSRTS